VKKFLVLAVLSALALGVTGAAVAFSQGNGATAAANWKVSKFNSSGQAYATRVATTTANGIGFDFLPTPDDALFTTTQKNSGLLGNLTGKTVQATFTVTGDSFTYYGEGTESNPCLSPASVRLYFTGDTTGKFAYTKYWWSNPAHVDLAAGTFTLEVPLSGDLWSDWNGQSGITEAAGFAAAVKKVASIGLSFGGGCFFANGVGAPNGGSFELSSYTVS
jgi:hypothetical protein